MTDSTKTIGYYDMALGQGNATQVASITASGNTAVNVLTPDATTLESLDVLVIQNPDNYGFGSEYLNFMATIEQAVQNGLVVIIHDRNAGQNLRIVESILPGNNGIMVTWHNNANLELDNNAHDIAIGVGGVVNDLSLDGGNFSSHGYTLRSSLPNGSDVILTEADANRVVTFAYGYGQGTVIYSTIPLDYYLGYSSSVADAMQAYAANLIEYAVGRVNVNLVPQLTGVVTTFSDSFEDTAVTITLAQLTAGYTDPEGAQLTITGLTANHGTVIDNGDGTFTITPQSNFAGAMILTYQVTDGINSISASNGFDILAVNDAPSANGTATALPYGIEDSSFVITAANLLADYSDVEGDNLSIVGLTVDHGTVTDNGDGTFTIMPDIGFYGQLNLYYDVTDGQGGVLTTTANALILPLLSGQDEIRVNMTTTGDQTWPRMAILKNGDYVILWQSNGQDGSGTGIYAQRYNASGEKLSYEVPVNNLALGDQQSPSVTALSDGGYVIAWESYGQDGSDFGIYAQRYDSNGNVTKPEFRVNDYTPNTQWGSSVTALSDGGFIVAYVSNKFGGNLGLDIFYQRFNVDGNLVGGETLVNHNTASSQILPKITQLNNGNIVIVWASYIEDAAANEGGSQYQVSMRVYDATMTSILVNEARVNLGDGTGFQIPTDIEVLSDGDYIVVWEDSGANDLGDGHDGSGEAVYAQRFTQDGTVSGQTWRVNSATSGNQSNGQITVLNDGSYVISWTSAGQDGSDDGVYAQRFDVYDAPLGEEFQINQTTSGEQGAAVIVATGDGGFIATWHSADGDQRGIYQRHFGPINHSPTLTGTQATLVSGTEDTAYVLSAANLLAGFSDADGEALSVVGLTADHGTVTDNGDSTYTIRPLDNYAGEVALSYQVTDGISSITASNSFNILAFNDAPEVVNTINFTPITEIQTFTFTLAQLLSEYSDADGDTISLSNLQVSGATLTDRGDGTFEVQPNPDLYLNWKQGHGAMEVVISYEISDGLSEPIVATKTVTVVPEITSGSETQVNSYTANEQSYPAISSLSDGGHIIVWQSYGQDGSREGIYSQRYSHLGVPIGGEQLVNSTTAASQFYASVAGLNDGGYVVVWESNGQDGSEYGIYGQRYNADGASVGSEFLVNSFITGSQSAPSITALSDGGYVVSWMSMTQDGSNWGIFAQKYDKFGLTVGGEVQVNTYTASHQAYPSITALKDGAFVITWESLNQDGSSYGVYSKLFNADGAFAETLVNSYTDNVQFESAVSSLSDGGYVVVWSSLHQDGSEYGVYAQRYNASGVKVGPETLVNSMTLSYQGMPTIAGLSDGGYVVVWSSLNQEGANWGIYAQRFDTHGEKIGGEFFVNEYTDDNQLLPSVAALESGGYVITWQSRGQDGSDFGIYQRVFTPLNHLPALTQTAKALSNGLEDAPYIVSASDLLSGFIDIDGDTLTVENIFADHGTVVDNGNGTFTITPTANYFGVVTIGYDISDGRGGRVNTSREITFADVVDYFIGTPDSQIVSGTDGADYIDGGAGNDTMLGYGGDDTFVVDSRKDVVTEYLGQGTDTVESSAIYYLSANIENLTLTGTASIYGVGNDLVNTLTGNSGDNMLFGLAGNDTLSGGSGLDVLVGGDGDDTLDGGADRDQLKGGNGNDVLFGGDTGDSLKGEAGNDYLDGGSGADTFYGGAGDDTYIVDDALDFLFEVNGEGYDRVQSSISYTLRNYFEDLTLTGVANINGVGNTSANIIIGNSGNNQLFGMFGNDTIFGGLGNDTVVGGDSNDVLYGEDGNDQLKGGYGNDSLFGGAGNDNLKGEENHDYIDGGLGVDSMYGGAGNDTYVASELGDFYVENLNEGTDTVLASITFTLGNNLENLTLTGTGNINGTGNAGFNILIGNAGNNTLSGMDGTDRITGGAGNDTLLGGNGNDTYYFDLGFGQDEINDAVGTNRITFGAGIVASDVITQVVGADLFVALKDADPLVTAANATNRIKIIGGATVAPTITYTPPAVVAESSALSAAITTFSAPTSVFAVNDNSAPDQRYKVTLSMPIGLANRELA